jgi:hypothetical protein
MAAPRTFTKSGRALTITHRAGVRTSPLGRFDPNTGLVWQHPRVRLESIRGRSVTVTNPRASLTGPRNQMTASLGMGGVGQRGRNRDVGDTKAPGESAT